MARGDTKRRITDATLRLVAERGFDATPITAIEAEAGLIPGNGSFYRHFASKEDALMAAVDAEVQRVQALSPHPGASTAPTDGGPDDTDALRRRFLADLALLRELRALILILARDGTRVPRVVAAIRHTLLDSGLLEYSALARTPAGDGDHRRAEAIGTVILTSLVGYHLSASYFGAPPGGVDADGFAGALAELVSAERRTTGAATGR